MTPNNYFTIALEGASGGLLPYRSAGRLIVKKRAARIVHTVVDDNLLLKVIDVSLACTPDYRMPATPTHCGNTGVPDRPYLLTQSRTCRTSMPCTDGALISDVEYRKPKQRLLDTL